MSNKSPDLEKITVGELKKLDGKIELIAYDENWPKLFEIEKEAIMDSLGDRVLLLEHVGSTSVPGLMAKPIIDIILEVEDSGNEDDYVPALEANGFKLQIREPDWFEHRMLKGLRNEVNLHVFSKNCSESKVMMDFRDHLISNKDDFALYQATKVELSQRDWEYVQQYADAKTEVILDIKSRI